MRGLRFFLALYLSKAIRHGIDLLAKGRGTNLPGAVALKIDPQFLRHIRGIDPEKTVFITGTNGKSTTTGLLSRVLTEAGFQVISNLDGANMTAGVAVPLLQRCSLSGRVRCDYVVMETDERYVSRIRQQIPAKYLCITNIQKDQVQRNGEPSFISRKIRQAIRPDMTVFVNQDEPNSCALASDAGTVIRYGVSPHEQSYAISDDFFAVSMPCPVCHNAIRFTTYNLDNVGPFQCPVCGLGSTQTPDYLAEDVSFTKSRFSVDGQVYPFHYNLPQFLYSYVPTVAMARHLGVDGSVIARAFDGFVNASDRMSDHTVAGKRLKFYKMKQENSETLQAVVNTISRDSDEKAFLFGCDEYIDFYPPYINTCFLFDCDFRRLRDSGVSRLICASTAMGHICAARFLYDGFDPNTVQILQNSLEPTLQAELSTLDCENVYLVEEIPFWKR